MRLLHRLSNLFRIIYNVYFVIPHYMAEQKTYLRLLKRTDYLKIFPIRHIMLPVIRS